MPYGNVREYLQSRRSMEMRETVSVNAEICEVGISHSVGDDTRNADECRSLVYPKTNGVRGGAFSTSNVKALSQRVRRSGSGAASRFRRSRSVVRVNWSR
jgi:hypothetical protein